MAIELAEDDRPKLKRWFALMESGLIYIGHFATLEDALMCGVKNTIWVFDEDTAREWSAFLTEAVK